MFKYLILSFFFLFNLISFSVKAQTLEIAINKLSEGLGNKNSLKEARYILFSYSSENLNQKELEHTYLYDRKTKDCRFEGETKEGENLVVLFNAERKSGELYISKKKSYNTELVKKTIQHFFEESYFLFTPILIADEHIKASLQGSEIIDSKRFFILTVKSSGIGFEFSKLYINSQNGSISKWETFNKNEKITHQLILSRKKDIGGGLTLATQFTDQLNGKHFQYPIVAALLNINASKFKTP